MSLWNTIGEQLAAARAGSVPSWILLVILLPFVGHAIAWSWGPRAHLAAQRALILVALDWGLSLLLAWPIHVVPLLVGVLPLLGAAFPRRVPTLAGDPVVWFAACAMAAIPISLNHFDPFVWSTVWFVVLVGVAGVRGLVEPAWARLGPLWARFFGGKEPDSNRPEVADDAPATIK